MQPANNTPPRQTWQWLNVNHRNSIRFKLISTVFIIMMIYVFIFLYFSYTFQTKRVNQQVENSFSLLADVLENDLSRWVKNREKDVVAMAVNPLVIEHIDEFITGGSNTARVKAELQQYWQGLQTNYEIYDEIYFVSSTGDIMISTNPERENTIRARDEMLTKPLETGGIYFQDAYMSHENKPSIAFSIPMQAINQENSSHNGYVGVLVCRIDIETVLQPLLASRINLGDTGEVILINQDKTAINELRNQPGSALNYNLTTEPALRAVRGEEGSFIGIGYNGREMLSVYRFLPETRWGIIVRQETAEIFGPVKSEALRFVITGLTALLFILLVMFLTLRRFLKPVKVMAEAARDISRGNLSRRLAVVTTDEIGVLSQSLNFMASNLEQQFKVQKNRQDVLQSLVDNLKVEAMLAKTLNIICASYNFNVGAIYLVDDRQEKLVCNAMYCPGQELNRRKTIMMGEGLEGYAALNQKTQKITDITEDTTYTVNWLGGNLQPANIVAIPVVLGSDILGVISLASVNSISEQDIEQLTDISTLIGVAVNNALANEKTRQLSLHLQELNEQLAQQNEELNAQGEELLSQTEELQAQSEELLNVTQELQVKNAELIRVGEQKSRFIANLSHELRAPLSAVISFSDVLLDKIIGELNQQQEKYLHEILNSGQHLLNLINGLLDHSKIEAGQLELNLEDIDPAVPLEGALVMVSADISRKCLHVTNSVKQQTYRVKADRDRLRQVFLNLLTNAIKFTPQDGKITIGSRANNNFVEFWIADTGDGIAKHDHQTIFEEFRQGENAAGKVEGTGLGLAITKKILELHGGEIYVHSDAGQGAIFTFTLPVVDRVVSGFTNHNNRTQAKVTVAYLQKPLDKTILLEQLDKINHHIAHPQPTVLIIDDDPAVRSYLAAILEPRGYKLLEAENGVKGIELACAQKPDIITLDMIMPGADGFEVMEQLGQQDWEKELYFFILTSIVLTKEDRAYLESRF